MGWMARRGRALLGASALAAPLAAPGGRVGVHAQPVPLTPETVAIPLTEKTVLGAPRELRLGRLPLPAAGRVRATPGARFQPWLHRRGPRRADLDGALPLPGGRALLRGAGPEGADPASDGEYLERYDCDRTILSEGVERGARRPALGGLSLPPHARRAGCRQLRGRLDRRAV